MGVGLYLKPVNKDGRSLIYLRAKKGKQTFIKSTFLKVKPSDWISRNYQVKGGSDNSIILNRKLSEVTSNMNLAWSLFESGSYTWDELCVKLGGGSLEKQTTVYNFIETVIKAQYPNSSSYNTYLGVANALHKELGNDKILLVDLTNDLIEKAVIGWKKRISKNSLQTYLIHLGKIKNLAYEKGLISEPFIRRSNWKVKKDSSIVIIKTVKTEDFLEGIPKAKDIYDIQALFFYLLMFCLRGFYQADIVTMHQYENNLEPYKGFEERRYIRHRRSKTGELMEINISTYPVWQMIAVLIALVKRTHGEKKNKKTGKPFKKGNYNILPKAKGDGWIFSYDINNTTIHKNVWDIYQKRIKSLLGVPFKTARKTFESYALKLKISSDLRYKLLGHKDTTIKAHYTDWEWDELKAQVDEAHQMVLDDYQVEKIYKAIHKRGKELGL